MSDFNAEEIAALNDDDFREFVTKHLHPATGDSEAWKTLFDSSLIDRTDKLLIDMAKHVDAQFVRKARERDAYQLECLRTGSAGRREWERYLREHQDWRKRANAFKNLVAGRRIEVKAAQKRARAATQAEYEAAGTHRYREIVRQLAVRIHQHQALTAASGRAPEQHDYDVWRLLDDLTVPVGPEHEATSLRNMLRTYWFDTTPATAAEGRQARAERLMRQAPGGRSPRYEGTPKARHVTKPDRLA